MVFGQGAESESKLGRRGRNGGPPLPAPNRHVIQSRGAGAELLVTSPVPPAPRADLDMLRFRLGAYSHSSLSLRLMSLLRLAAAPSPSHSGAARRRVTLRLDARRCPPLRSNPRPRRLGAAWERDGSAESVSRRSRSAPDAAVHRCTRRQRQVALLI
jgi:hypothetical protein